MMKENAVCRSFAPAGADENAEILILGSMPGMESLRQRQYYAFRRNAFWRIMGKLCGFDAAAPYEERLTHLARGNIALWDVLQNCERKGSSDTKITNAIPNEIGKWLNGHPRCRHIFCNGSAAATYFKKFFPQYVPWMTQLPSTSPAAATLTEAQKLQCYQIIRQKTESADQSGSKLNASPHIHLALGGKIRNRRTSADKNH